MQHCTTCDQDKVNLKLCSPANSDLYCSLRMCELLAGMHADLPYVNNRCTDTIYRFLKFEIFELLPLK